MEKMEEVLAVTWKEHKKNPSIMEEEADRMFGSVGIGLNNFAHQDCKQRIIVIFKPEDIDKIQKRLLSKPLLLKAVVVQEQEKRASVMHAVHADKLEYALLVNTRSRAIEEEIRRIFGDVKEIMGKGKKAFCCPIDINHAFNAWHKSFYKRQSAFHVTSHYSATYCAAIYFTNVVESTEGGTDETQVVTCGKCKCMHHM